MSSQGQKLRAVGPEHLRGSPAEWEPAGKRGRLLLDAPSGPGLQTGLLGAAITCALPSTAKVQPASQPCPPRGRHLMCFVRKAVGGLVMDVPGKVGKGERMAIRFLQKTSVRALTVNRDKTHAFRRRECA